MSSVVTLSSLESHLWEAANILRGSPVDRTDWKSYILPLLFFKRICDVWDEEYQEAFETYGEDFVDEHRFQVPEGTPQGRRSPGSLARDEGDAADEQERVAQTLDKREAEQQPRVGEDHVGQLAQDQDHRPGHDQLLGPLGLDAP